MKRREFISLIGGAAVAWPLTAHAQQQSIRRIGVLMSVEEDARGHARYAAFRDALANLGWSEGRNLSIAARWSQDVAHIRSNAADLVALKPEVIFASPAPAAQALKQQTKTIPIVFALTPDPITLGLIDSLARPGGNITGFATYDEVFATKWIELLKQIAPSVGRVAIIADPRMHGPGYLTKTQLAAQAIGLDVLPYTATDAQSVENVFAQFASQPSIGFIVPPSTLAVTQRELVVSLAAKYRLPGIYAFRYYPAIGGLASYGIDDIEEYKRAATYVDRILRGDKPGDLPVQQPTKFELVINVKTAKALGLTIPPNLLALADEVIE